MTAQRKTPFTLYVVMAALALSNGAVFALLAEMQDRYGFATWGLGLIGGAAFVSGFVAQVGLARFADQGHARKLLVSGLVLSAVGTIGMGVGSSLMAFTAMRLMIGLGYGMFVPAARRIIIEADPSQAGRVLGRLASFSTGGFVLGPPIAAAVASVYGLRAPFLAVAAVVLVCVPAVLRSEVPEFRGGREHRAVRSLLRIPQFQAALALGAAFYLSIGVFEAVWARYLTDLGSSTFFVGVTLLVFGVPMALFAPLGGRLGDRYGGFKTASVALTISVPFMATYGQLTSLTLITILIAVHAFSDATTTPGIQLAVARAAPPDQTAAAQGMLEASNFILAAISAVASAPVYQAWGAAWLFGGSAALMLPFIAFARFRVRGQ